MQLRILFCLCFFFGSSSVFVGQSKDVVDDRAIQLGDMKLPLVFEEDFEHGLARWELTDDTAWKIGQSKSTDGEITKSFELVRRKSNYQPKHRSPHNIALVKDLRLSAFVIQFDVRSTKDTGNHRDCCVFFGHQNPNQFYYTHLGAKPDPASGQIMIVNNAARRPLTKNQNRVGWDDNWHKVQVSRNSETGEIKVYFDDMKKPLMTVIDKTFEKGRLGIGSFDDMNEFDNIRIYGK